MTQASSKQVLITLVLTSLKNYFGANKFWLVGS